MCSLAWFSPPGTSGRVYPCFLNTLRLVLLMWMCLCSLSVVLHVSVCCWASGWPWCKFGWAVAASVCGLPFLPLWALGFLWVVEGGCLVCNWVAEGSV